MKVVKRPVKRQETKKNNNIKNFLIGPYPIIIYLSILIIILLVFNYKLARTPILYTFSGETEEASILEGSIYIGNDINNFSAPNIIFNGDNISLKDYTIGYYIKDGKDLIELSIATTNQDKETVKIKDILNASEWSFTEQHKNAKYFSKDNIEKLDKLCFIIEGTDSKDEEVSYTIPLTVTKISK